MSQWLNNAQHGKLTQKLLYNKILVLRNPEKSYTIQKMKLNIVIT